VLIDEFMPTYDVRERHEIDVHAPVEKVYAAINSCDLSRSGVIRLLFLLRGMPRSAVTLEGLRRINFSLLGEIPNQEILLGLVGRFWTLCGDLQRVDADGFRRFDKGGYARATWNFSLAQRADSTTRVVTETRVQCTDEASRRRFLFYWRLIGPFSALTRRRMLRLIKRQAQRGERFNQ
jgi:hypothetical protein